MVIGALGTVTYQLVSDLRCLPTTQKTESQIKGMQPTMLCFFSVDPEGSQLLQTPIGWHLNIIDPK